MDTNRPTVKGRAVEVDILEEGAGFVLSVGPVSLWLGPNAALDVLDTLARAIAAERGQEPPHDAPSSRSSVRRRIFS
jgi:hypothetical protein